MKKQAIIIHGGDSFGNHEEYLDFLKNFEVTIDYFRPRGDWKKSLQEKLGENYDVLLPVMPNKQNAKFGEWKIWFEKLLPFVEDGAIFIGHSLGGMFLAKYLAENDIPKRVGVLILVAAPHNNTGEVGDFVLPNSLDGVSRQSPQIFLFYSKDDGVVPFSEGEVYKKQLLNAELRVFEDRGHFNQQEFPEILEVIKSI